MACGQLTINDEPKIRLWSNSAVSKFIRDNDVKNFIDNLVSGLNKNSEFTLNTISEYTLLRDKIEEFVKANGRLSADQKQEILDGFASYLFDELNINKNLKSYMGNFITFNCTICKFNSVSEREYSIATVQFVALENGKNISTIIAINDKAINNIIVVNNPSYLKNVIFSNKYTHCFQLEDDIYYLNLTL